MTAVALRPTGRLQIEDSQDFWTAEQVAALQVLGIKGATNGDLSVFFHYCHKTGLDPFSRQIYMIQRREKQGNDWISKQTIQVGIDGFRVIRDRAAKRDGVTVDYEDTVWYDADGAEHKVWLSEDAPVACRVVLVKHTPTGDLRYPGVLRTAAYMATKDGKPVSQWKTQPDHMIEKCCEAFANRRAFPHDLSGVYIEEEQAARVEQPPAQRRVTAAHIIDPEPEPAPEPERPPRDAKPATPAALERLNDLAASLDLGPDEDVLVIYEWLGGSPWNATTGQVRTVTAQLKSYAEAAEGDLAVAQAAIWEQYRAVHSEEVAAVGDGGA